MSGYYSDGCLAMWELKVLGETYWFVCTAHHPLGALQFVLAADHIDSEIDDLESCALDSEELADWSLRIMEAAEEFSISGDDDVGPFKMGDECEWRGTVKEAVDLCGEDNWVICSTTWLR